MDIRIHIPLSSHLSGYVTALWESKFSQSINESILPKGIIEIIFNLGDPMDGLLPGSDIARRAPLCFIQGLYTKSIFIKFGRRQHLFGIRLQHGMVKKLLGVLPSELKDNLIDLNLVNPALDHLWYQLMEAGSFEERVKVIEAEFPILANEDCRRTEALSRLFNADSIEPFQSVQDLSQQVFYSSRHLNRKTQAMFGMSAEELISYKKFMHAIKLLHIDESSLSAIALEAGFYDQAHFCRIFKSLTGITPNQYRKQKSILPFHIFHQA